MNELIILSKTYSGSNATEIRNYEKSDVPFVLHPDMTKYKGRIFLANRHIDIELLFITDGKLKIHLDNDVFYGKSNDIIVVNPNVLHNIVPLTDTVTYECIIIDRDFFNRHGLSLDNVHVKELINDEFLFDNIRNIKTLMINKPKYYIARVNTYLLNLSLTLLEKYSTEKESTSDTNTLLTIEKGIEYLNKHFNEQITIDDIAEYVGYSKFYFCRRFKEITGYTVTTYINMKKIKYAKNLLNTSDMNINEIALKCGFNSVTYFSTTFKKYMGINPSDIKTSKQK